MLICLSTKRIRNISNREDTYQFKRMLPPSLAKKLERGCRALKQVRNGFTHEPQN